MTIERIKEAFEALGWEVRPDAFKGRVVALSAVTPTSAPWQVRVDVSGWHSDWHATIDHDTTYGDPCPLRALRLAYADEDSRSTRAALWPVLVALREPEMERLRVALSHIDALEKRWLESLWFDRVDACVLGLLGRLPDAADRYLLALDLAGDPPEELCEAVAGLRAALEVMG